MSLEPIRARPLSTTFASIKPAVTQPVADTVARRDVFVTAAAKAEVPGSDIKLLPYFGQFSISSNDNACGTTALSIILASEGLIGREVEDGQAVDNAVRPWGGYSAPRDLTAYAFSKGLSSQSYNKASFDDLAARLKSGNKVLCMVDGPHWIVPLGTYTEPTTGEKRIKYMDPAGGEGSRDVSQKEFEAMWARPNQAVGKFSNNTMGYQNYMLAFDKDATRLAPGGSFGLLTTETAADGISDVGNAWPMLKRGKVPAAVGSLAGGAVKTVSAVPGMVGAAIQSAGTSTLNTGLRMLDRPGVGNKVGGVAVTGGGAVVTGVGAVVHGAGNVVAGVGDAAGTVVKALLNWW